MATLEELKAAQARLRNELATAEPSRKAQIRMELADLRTQINRSELGGKAEAVSSTLSDALSQHKERVAEFKKDTPKVPATPSILLDSEEKRQAADEPDDQPTPPSTPKSVPVISSPSPKTDKPSRMGFNTAEKRFLDLDSKLDDRLNELQTRADEKMDRNDMIEALGNVAIDLVKYLRLAQAPSGAPAPDVQMPRIDFSKLNDRELRQLAVNMQNVKDKYAGQMRAVYTDLADRRAAEARDERAVESGPEVDRTALRQERAAIERAKSDALKNMDDDKKFAGALRNLGVDEEVIDDMIGRGLFDLEESNETKRQIVEEAAAAKLGQVMGGSPTEQGSLTPDEQQAYDYFSANPGKGAAYEQWKARLASKGYNI